MISVDQEQARDHLGRPRVQDGHFDILYCILKRRVQKSDWRSRDGLFNIHQTEAFYSMSKARSTLKVIDSKISLPSPPECTTRAQRQLVNDDLLPVPLHKRQWTATSYASFWIADAFNINTFMIASAGMAA